MDTTTRYRAGRLLTAVLLLVAALGLAYLLRFYLRTTAHEPEGVIAVRLEMARRIEAAEVEKLCITVSRYDGSPPGASNAILYGGRDRRDIERVLTAIRSIRVSKNKVRVPAMSDQILILPERGGAVHIRGCFDPRRVPIISPSMRSNDLAAIAQDIAKRKGEPL